MNCTLERIGIKPLVRTKLDDRGTGAFRNVITIHRYHA